MKKILPLLLFAVVFPFGCISTSFDLTHTGYFGPHGTFYTYARELCVFIVIFVLTALNKANVKRIGICICTELGIITALTLFDYFVSKHYIYNYYYALLLCISIITACIAAFCGASFSFKDGYGNFYKLSTLSFVPIYLFTLFICFIRTPGSFELTVNTVPGRGTLKFFKYLVINPAGNFYTSLICLGNLFILLPLPFILYNIIKTRRRLLFPVIGIIMPLLFEGYQYIFKCGNVDIDDILLNFTGFIIGWLLTEILIKRKTQHSEG